LKVGVLPTGQVWVDDRPLGYAPAQLKLSPGRHVVAAGETSAQDTQVLVLEPGEQRQVLFDLDAHEFTSSDANE
jgi:hypothetical protein